METVEDLQTEIRNLNAKIQQLEAEAKDLRHAEDIVRHLPPEVLTVGIQRRTHERASKDNPDRLRAQVDMLRGHLRQELAVNEYLSENQKEGTVVFNKLPIETRKAYFERVDAKL